MTYQQMNDQDQPNVAATVESVVSIRLKLLVYILFESGKGSKTVS